jgi:hypothetical protein
VPGRGGAPTVLNRLYTLLARARKAVVVAGLALAVAYVIIDVARDGQIGAAVFPWTFTLSLTAGLLCWWPARRYRPAALVSGAKGHYFEVPPSPVPVLAFTAMTPPVAEKVSTTIDRVSKQIDPWWVDILDSALWLLLLVLVVRLVWRGAGVRLRPDGILDQKFAGSLFAPWEALEAGVPPVISRPSEVTLTYRHPVLVKGRGILRRTRALTAWNVDSVFLARVIQEYASRPERRSAIGTEAELDRLLRP